MIERLQQDIRGLQQVFKTSYRHWTTGREIRTKWRAARQAGEKIVLDDFGPPIPRPKGDEPVADFSPKTDVKDRKAKFMTLDEYPSTNYAFEVKHPPVSGNYINGLGETEHRLASPIFHTWQFGHPMGKLEFLFQGIRQVPEWIALLKRQWNTRRFKGEIAPVRQPVDDSAEMTKQIKALTLELGACMVGIAPLTVDMLKEDHPFDYPYVISFGVQMDRDAALQAPSLHSGLKIQEEYRATDRISAQIADHIRGLGWEAESSIHKLLEIPAAIEAGLGQLGKHGSMLSKELGSMYRLGSVVTRLPLVIDGPEDIGVDDFCARCQVCVTNCPPHAIFKEKQMVRGRERWYVDFDTCIPYFAENHGCGICIGVCPWSDPGRGESISLKMLARRAERKGA